MEDRERFSQSLLWDLQRRYFADMGVGAWRDGDVPQYVTSNPRIADAYAQVVFGFWRDLERQTTGLGAVMLCELGAGSGRFAFHFLKRLTRLCEESGVAPASAFRYVLSDYAQRNLDAWRAHSSFTPFFESGLLDVALFDVTQSDTLMLQVSREAVVPGTLALPLIVIANYLFDSIPQELFYVDEGRVQDCRISLALMDDPTLLDARTILAGLECRYDVTDLADVPFPEPLFQQFLEDYRSSLLDTHLLFPAQGLRCLGRLQALSQRGLLLLSADKGDHRLDDIQGRPPPRLVRHGSFSLTVNYHALGTYCEAHGGIALFPTAPHESVNIGCLLMVPSPGSYFETQSAYRRVVEDFGPDDFFTLTKQIREHMGEMTVPEVLAFLRLSLDDSHQFAHSLPRLAELGPEMTPEERQAVRGAAARAWDFYFPLGEDHDLAYQMGELLYAMDDYPGAIEYFERSLAIYGPHTGGLFNMAACYGQLEQAEAAIYLLRTVLETDPTNIQALALLAEYTT